MTASLDAHINTPKPKTNTQLLPFTRKPNLKEKIDSTPIFLTPQKIFKCIIKLKTINN